MEDTLNPKIFPFNPTSLGLHQLPVVLEMTCRFVKKYKLYPLLFCLTSHYFSLCISYSFKLFYRKELNDILSSWLRIFSLGLRI